MLPIDSKSRFSTNRIQALTDGIFAIAMTLLVLSIDLPDKDLSLKGAELHRTLLGQINQLYTYVISFVLLAVFWTIHHVHYKYIRETNRLHLWINIFMLIFICLVPYTSTLTSDFPGDWMTNLFFNLNMFFIAFFYFLNWEYATKKKRLVDDEMSDERIKQGRLNLLKFVSISLIAICLSFIIPSYASLAYLLLFILIRK